MKKLQFALMALLALTLTSCFEVVEEITLNPDGSGKMKVVVNLSQSKDNIANFMKVGEVNGQKIPTEAEIRQKMKEASTKLASIKGISNLKEEYNFTDYIFTVTGNFANVTALNQAINSLADEIDESPQPIPKERNFSFANSTFKRHFDYEIETMSQAQYDQLPMMSRFMMETAKVRQIFRFASPIKKVDNGKATISSSGKSVKTEHTISELLTGKSSIAHTVNL